MIEPKALYVLSGEQLYDLASHLKQSVYDPVIGLSKKEMMRQLGISSDTTFYDRVRRGKIKDKEIGGSTRYFFE